MNARKEFLKFLDKDSRTDIKLLALHELLGLTGSKEGCKTVQEDAELLRGLFQIIGDKNDGMSKNACLILVNISATEEGAKELINADTNGGKEILIKLIREVLNPDSSAGDACCMTLSNITRKTCYAQLMVDYLNEENITIHDLVNAFVKINFNSKGCNLDYMAPFFSNLTQSPQFRRQLMDEKSCPIQKLVPFVKFERCLIRRGGIVATIRNCCFDLEYHELLLGSDVDLLPVLLLPLAGPEEFDEEDMDKLPLELQYLGEDKKREVDEDIRKLLLEALNQLCASRNGREFLRKKNTYIILREYHKWEKDRSLLLACENVIDILIRTEEEIGEDNLKSIEVPSKYVKMFEDMDKDYLKQD